MKKISFVILLLALLVSCRNTDSEIDNSALVGTWNWVSTYGGIGNQVLETPASTGKNKKITFTADQHYVVETNNSTTEEGTYSLYKNISNTDHLERVFIHFSNKTLDVMIKNNDTNLYLTDDFPDGTESHYIK